MHANNSELVLDAQRIVELPLIEFGQLMLPQWFTCASADFQRRLSDELELALRGGARLLGALPREHGKTALGTLALSLREACRCWLAAQPGPQRPRSWEPKRHIIFIGANQQEASHKLRLLQTELETNQLVNQYFPGIGQVQRSSKGQPRAVNAREILYASGLRLAAYGVHNALRGSVHGGQRPDLVLLDDPETDSGCASQQRRQNLRAWCERALLPALDNQRGSLVWLGTLLHSNAVLAEWIEKHGAAATADPGRDAQGDAAAAGPWHSANAQLSAATQLPAHGAPLVPVGQPVAVPSLSGEHNPRWRTLFMPALDVASGEPLWPARWSRAALAQRADEIGEKAFMQEYLLRPESSEAQRFRLEDFLSFDPELLERRRGRLLLDGEELTVVAAIDPAIGEDAQHDYSAVAVVGLVDDSAAQAGNAAAAPPFRCYVLEIERLRGRFSEQLELLQRLNRRWQPQLIGVESTAYQRVLCQAAADHGLPAVELQDSRHKSGRVENLSVAAARRMLFLPSAATWRRGFSQEACAWPAAAHDDQLDALSWALQLGSQTLARARRRGSLSILGVRGGWDGLELAGAADWPAHPAHNSSIRPRAA